MTWNKILKSGFLNANKMPLRKHENILIFYKHLPVYNPIMEQGPPLHGKGKSYKNKELTNNNYGKFHATDDNRKGCTEKYPSSILKISKGHPSKAKHRTEKPIALSQYFIETFTNPGMVVIDNAAGMGNVGKACMNTGRKFILFEKDKEIYDNALVELNKYKIILDR